VSPSAGAKARFFFAIRDAEAPLFHGTVDRCGGSCIAGVAETSTEVPFDFAQGRLSLRSGWQNHLGLLILVLPIFVGIGGGVFPIQVGLVAVFRHGLVSFAVADEDQTYGH